MNILAFIWIRTCDPSKRAASDLRLLDSTATGIGPCGRQLLKLCVVVVVPTTYYNR